MKSISIDFINHRVCIMTDGQQGTQIDTSVSDKSKFKDMFPNKELMDESDSFTWNFENNLFAVNENYVMSGKPNEIMTEDCFIPKKIISFPGLSDQYEKMLSLMEYEEVKWTEDDFKDFPDEIKELFGNLFE